MYAKLCKVIYDSLARHFEDENTGTKKRDIFKLILLTKCRDEFENRRDAFEKYEFRTEPLSADDEEQRSIAKQKMLGNIRFVCELGKQQLLPQNILHDCIKQLLSKKKTQSLADKIQDLECLCEIMKNIGYLLEEKEEARGLLDQYFERMESFSKNPELISRIRFMLLDVIDLRKNNWIPRQKEALPSTISDPKNDYRDNEVLLSQYGFPFIRQNMNQKSPRYDDVFSQINLGPYYLGTGPGAINDVNHLPNMNSYGNQAGGGGGGGRRNNNNYQNNYNNQGGGGGGSGGGYNNKQFPNYQGQRDGGGMPRDRRDGGRGGGGVGGGGPGMGGGGDRDDRRGGGSDRERIEREIRGMDRGDRDRDGYRGGPGLGGGPGGLPNSGNHSQQPPNAVNMLSNGLNQLNANRDMINLPPRFQKQQMKQGGGGGMGGGGPVPAFQPFVKNELQPMPDGLRGPNGPGGLQVNKPTLSIYKGDKMGLLGPKPVAANFASNAFAGGIGNGGGGSSNGGGKFGGGNPMMRQNMNGKDMNSFVNEMGQLKVTGDGDGGDSSSSEPSKPVNVIVEVEKLLSEYFKSENSQDFINGLKTIHIAFDETLLVIIRIAIGKAEAERDLAYKLIIKMKAGPGEGAEAAAGGEEGGSSGSPQGVTDAAFLAALKNLFCKVVELEVETPRARSLVAGFVAQLIIEGAIGLKEVGDLLEGGQHYPLFPLLLQNLHKAKGQPWLFEAFTESKISLISMLPENDRNKERMADILEDRNLTFLYPMLRIESDITRQITSPECTPATLYRWLKDNVTPPLQSSTEFISVVFTALVKHIISKHTSAETPAVYTSALFSAQEAELAKYQQVLKVYLSGKPDLQLVALYSLQTYCHTINFPKGLLEKWFNFLYEFEIVDEEVYAKWKEDINDEYPGKGRALFQVNKWLTWLEETEEDEDEE